MDLLTQVMYWSGTIVLLIAGCIIAIKTFAMRQEQDYEDWQEEWKKQIEEIGKRTQSISG